MIFFVSAGMSDLAKEMTRAMEKAERPIIGPCSWLFTFADISRGNNVDLVTKLIEGDAEYGRNSARFFASDT